MIDAIAQMTTSDSPNLAGLEIPTAEWETLPVELRNLVRPYMTVGEESVSLVSNERLVPTANEGMGINAIALAFQFAMLGSAASERGLRLPDRVTLQRFVEAGVTKSQANQAYGAFAMGQGVLKGMAQRANLPTIDQAAFEQAVLLSDPASLSALNQATGAERALGRAGGGFGVELEQGRVTQTGRI
jgi:hypothetical protein